MIRKILLPIIATLVLSSCKKGHNSTIETDSSGILKSVTNDQILNPSDKTFEKHVFKLNSYTDSNGGKVTIQNSLPKGGLLYTDPSGKKYIYAIFWTKIDNETANSLELAINFPEKFYDLQSSHGRQFRLYIPSDTLSKDRIGALNFGLTDLDSFLNKNIYKSSSFNRTINPKGSSGFYVITLFNKPVEGTLRTDLSLRDDKIIYTVNGTEIICGSVNLNHQQFN